MSEHLARIVVGDQVVYEGHVQSGYVATTRFDAGPQLTADGASGPVPIEGRFAPDVTTVTFGPKPAAAKEPSGSKAKK